MLSELVTNMSLKIRTQECVGWHVEQDSQQAVLGVVVSVVDRDVVVVKVLV